MEISFSWYVTCYNMTSHGAFFEGEKGTWDSYHRLKYEIAKKNQLAKKIFARALFFWNTAL